MGKLRIHRTLFDIVEENDALFVLHDGISTFILPMDAINVLWLDDRDGTLVVDE